METASTGLVALLADPQRQYPASLRVTFGIVDPTLSVSAITVVPDSQIWFSDASAITQGGHLVNNYESLEHNRFILGSGGDVVPDNGPFPATGYTSATTSGGNGLISSPPLLTVTLGAVHSVAGLTISFDELHDDWCSNFEIHAYNGGTLLGNINIIANSANFILEHPIENFDKLVFKFIHTYKPYRRVRIAQIDFGITRVDEVFSGDTPARLEAEVSPVSDKLSSTKFEWTLPNFNKQFRPGQSTGIQRFVMAQQPVKFEWGYPVGGAVEWVLGGNLLTTGAVTFNRNQVTLTATDLLSYMTDRYNKGSFTPVGVSLFLLAVKVLEDADLPRIDGNAPWKLYAPLTTISSFAPLPKATGRELLQLIANCAGCILYTDRDGYITIKPPDNTQRDITIDYNSQTAFPTVHENPPLHSVTIGIGEYVVEEFKEILKTTISISASQLIALEYEESINHTISITGADSYTLIGAYAAYAEIQINVSAYVSVTISVSASPMTRTQYILNRQFGTAGEILPIENVLCTNVPAAEACTQFVGDFYAKRSIYTSDYNGHILLDPMDRVWMEDDFSAQVSGQILRNDITYNGAWRGRVKWTR